MERKDGVHVLVVNPVGVLVLEHHRAQEEDTVELKGPFELVDRAARVEDIEAIDADEQVGLVVVDREIMEFAVYEVDPLADRGLAAFQEAADRRRDGSTTTIYAPLFSTISINRLPPPSPALTITPGLYVCITSNNLSRTASIRTRGSTYLPPTRSNSRNALTSSSLSISTSSAINRRSRDSGVSYFCIDTVLFQLKNPPTPILYRECSRAIAWPETRQSQDMR